MFGSEIAGMKGAMEAVEIFLRTDLLFIFF